MNDPVRSDDGDAGVRFHLVHTVPGRTRIRVDAPDQLDDLVRAIEEFFHDHPGLREIRANRDCQSVVVTYDPEVFDARHLPVATEREDTSWTGWFGALRTTVTRVVEDTTTRAVRTLTSLVEALRPGA